jgi:hypothetical protein
MSSKQGKLQRERTDSTFKKNTKKGMPRQIGLAYVFRTTLTDIGD